MIYHYTLIKISYKIEIKIDTLFIKGCFEILRVNFRPKSFLFPTFNMVKTSQKNV